MKVYGDIRSGNCYKISLILALIGQRATWVDVDILKGDTQSAEFLALNPNGKIPVLELDDGSILTESNAIVYYLAKDSDFLPDDHLARSIVLQWQFFEQYTHEPAIAVARFIRFYQNMPETRRDEYRRCVEKGYKALDVMELQLNKSPFIAGISASIADISLFAYTHVADQADMSLSEYPAINAWLKRVNTLPGFVAMES